MAVMAPSLADPTAAYLAAPTKAPTLVAPEPGTMSQVPVVVITNNPDLLYRTLSRP